MFIHISIISLFNYIKIQIKMISETSSNLWSYLCYLHENIDDSIGSQADLKYTNKLSLLRKEATYFGKTFLTSSPSWSRLIFPLGKSCLKLFHSWTISYSVNRVLYNTTILYICIYNIKNGDVICEEKTQQQ